MSWVKLWSRSIIVLILLLPFTMYSQEDKTGNWIMYFGSNRVSEYFSIHSEIQYRNHTMSPNNIEQLLLRIGLNYHFSEKVFVTAGYAYVHSYGFESGQT